MEEWHSGKLKAVKECVVFLFVSAGYPQAEEVNLPWFLVEEVCGDCIMNLPQYEHLND